MIKIINQQNQDEIAVVLNRSQLDLSDVNEKVKIILDDVMVRKDEAVRYYTRIFDKVELDAFKVSIEEIEKAFQRLDPVLIEDLKKAKQNIEAFHEKQLLTSYEIKTETMTLKQRVTPIEVAGLYIPGGTAAYPSTVLMNAVPAKIAGVKKLIMTTPPDQNGNIKDSLLVAASICGVDEIYKVGGAQAVAAMAYGTPSIPKVDVITGPGNIYVAMAKKMVNGLVAIDMIAGPSEILIIADDQANPEYIAADLMSQAEHDTQAAAICITTSLKLAHAIKSALESQIKELERIDIIKASLQNHGAIIVAETLLDAIALANQIAPEHLELLVEEPMTWLDYITHAGAIFIGPYTPEAVGDYFAGPNHTLPTSGTARFSSALSVHDFMKKTSVIEYSRKALDEAKDSIIRLANEEGLQAHANAIKIRYPKG